MSDAPAWVDMATANGGLEPPLFRCRFVARAVRSIMAKPWKAWGLENRPRAKN